ncbi:MAG TPA: hypothetical protein VFH90_00710, partial [Candidatus Limnocylindria bacterium]|nr:hypothetical protein [Candidatus Limnocylindria bacterium]
MRPGGALRAGRGVVIALSLVAASWLGLVPPGPVAVRGAEYSMATTAIYDVQPDDQAVRVTIRITFRNTTPNPPNQFSVFEVIDLAVHDGARRLAAADGRGRLSATLEERGGVTVASIEPRDGVRYRDTVKFSVSYFLPDGASRDVRIRNSVVIFPVWSFGTTGRVEV